ncbi:polysaccharide pyruvyl transferase family protein [Subtercola endophyticus]|uniref:polysaccharide pyruvyl transferase family protein n=1 Tax=Subtercola endophyticus TaxID=2895559 RepID=UPI001E5B370D|nr:polysaccharide pyruvyl transferase family protein [Subtercola endophyticus]UFS57860.1 polysaccharide pyruvyl transferase family protein [Subtercola endophyticus]
MVGKLKAHWWSPRRSLKTFGAEMKQHSAAWVRLSRPKSSLLSNYGDELNHILLAEVSGRSVDWAPLGKEDVVAVGSILVPYFTQGGVGLIWGSGLNQPSVSPEQAARVSERFLAVRGPRTRDALGLAADIPLGDPGLLVRNFGIQASPRRIPKLLIPHFTVYNSNAGRRKMKALASAGFTIAAPNLPVRQMLHHIASSDFVASSGMHGMILSHALGRPVQLISFAETVDPEPGYKYGDYLASVNLHTEVISFTEVLANGKARDALISRAIENTEAVSVAIDELNTGLLAASRALR